MLLSSIRALPKSLGYRLTLAVQHSVLYRASWILLYRIFIPKTLLKVTDAPGNLMREASAACTAKAEEIHQLLNLYAKSFGPCNVTYVMIWSIVSLHDPVHMWYHLSWVADSVGLTLAIPCM